MIIRQSAGKPLQNIFRPCTSISTNHKSAMNCRVLRLVEVFVKGHNFCQTGFPPECRMKEQSSKSRSSWL